MITYRMKMISYTCTLCHKMWLDLGKPSQFAQELKSILLLVIQYRSITTSFLHTWTRVAPRGILRVKCQSFPWKILFTHYGTWHFHETSSIIYTRRGQPNGVWEKITITTAVYLANVATCNWNLWASTQFIFHFRMARSIVYNVGVSM